MKDKINRVLKGVDHHWPHCIGCLHLSYYAAVWHGTVGLYGSIAGILFLVGIVAIFIGREF